MNLQSGEKGGHYNKLIEIGISTHVCLPELYDRRVLIWKRLWCSNVDGELKDKILAPNESIRVKLFGDGQITTITNPKKLNKKMVWAQGQG